MGSGVGSTGKDRLEIAIESMKELVAKYESLGSDVLIQVNTFNATANGTGIWMTSSQLSTFLNGLNHSGNTNFEDALKETEDNYTLSPMVEILMYTSYQMVILQLKLMTVQMKNQAT